MYYEYEKYDDMSREEWLEYRREKKQEKREADVEHQKKMIIQRLMGCSSHRSPADTRQAWRSSEPSAGR